MTSDGYDGIRVDAGRMTIQRLVLDDFRSWRHCQCDFRAGATILEGSNGLGKTNIVEAIEVLSTGMSHRTSSLSSVITHGESRATIRAMAVDGVEADEDGNDVVGGHDDQAGKGLDEVQGRDRGRDDVTARQPSSTRLGLEATITARGANRGRVNGGPSVYLRDVVGRIPSVTFAPEDQRLVTDDPARRRTFLDQAGSLLIPGYTASLQTFEKVARQRAALLKTLSQTTGADDHAAALSGLEVWTGQFIMSGTDLTRKRRRVVDALAGYFEDVHSSLTMGKAGSGHHATMTYAPSFAEVAGVDDPHGDKTIDDDISARFRRIFPGEIAQGRNLIGPHRDDVLFGLDGAPAREFASNGEIWTMALALRLALFHVMRRVRGVEPIVILDDVFAQLDDERRSRIMDFARDRTQVIITTATAHDIPVLSDADVVDVRALRDRYDLSGRSDPSDRDSTDGDV